MSLANIVTVYVKELRDALRDRRTVISMIVVPTLIMPGLMAVAGFTSLKVMSQARATTPTVMLIGGDDSPRVRAALAANTKLRIVPTTQGWKKDISDKRVRAAVEIPAGFDAALEQGEVRAVKIYHYAGEMRSRVGLDALREFFDRYREETIAARLTEHGLPATLVKPFEIKSENVAPPEKVGGNAIGGIIPYFFLLLSFTGAMYPAMDLTAGEKERGTMETILCSPIARIDLVLGKFLVVLTASLVTVLFSLLSMVLTAFVAGSVVASAGWGGAGGRGAATFTALVSFDPLGVLAVIAMVVPMAVFFSAALMTISLFAKSFKEAQSYLSPLVIVILIPAVIGILPGVELNARLALVPVLNVSLASKELVSGVWPWNYLALIFGSTCLYAAVALRLAVRMFNREDVIFRA